MGEFRMEAFKKTLNKIALHNSDNSHKSTVGHNQFSDWTEAEYKRLLGYKGKQTNNEEAEILDTSNLADSMDWRSRGAVTPVKNQGQCGSCWAFSSTGAIEGSMFLSTGTLQSFSEQQLVDCSKQNNGCNGGLMDYAFQYVESSPLMLEDAYPYTARQGYTCQYVHPRVSVRLNPSRMSQETPLDNSSRLPLPRDQSLLPLRLTNSHSRATLAVSSPPDAEPNSTTVSSPLDTVPLTVPITSSSRTLGEPHGETRDTLESPQTSAVSPSSHHTPPAERFEQINDS